jgi:hypothetical protein
MAHVLLVVAQSIRLVDFLLVGIFATAVLPNFTPAVALVLSYLTLEAISAAIGLHALLRGMMATAVVQKVLDWCAFDLRTHAGLSNCLWSIYRLLKSGLVCVYLFFLASRALTRIPRGSFLAKICLAALQLVGQCSSFFFSSFQLDIHSFNLLPAGVLHSGLIFAEAAVQLKVATGILKVSFFVGVGICLAHDVHDRLRLVSRVCASLLANFLP